MVEDNSISMILAANTKGHNLEDGVCGVLGPVFYVPEICNCLLSVRQMDRQGCETRFKNGVCEILRSHDKKLILRAETIGKEGLYALSQGEFEDQMGLVHQLCMAHSIRTEAVSRLHYILNHASAQRCNYECTCHKFPGITTLLV